MYAASYSFKQSPSLSHANIEIDFLFFNSFNTISLETYREG